MGRRRRDALSGSPVGLLDGRSEGAGGGPAAGGGDDVPLDAVCAPAAGEDTSLIVVDSLTTAGTFF